MMMSNRFSRFGTICAHCNNELIIPEWTEHRNERKIHHLWRCWRCDFCFETIVSTKATHETTPSADINASRLVA
jgi:hypothetical protein